MKHQVIQYRKGGNAVDNEFQNDELLQRLMRRKRERNMPRWKRKLRKFWASFRLILLAFAMAGLVVGSGWLLMDLGGAAPTMAATEPTEATEPPTEPPTQPPTEPPTEAATEEPTSPPVGGVIYLTFDDGPGSQTARLLEILKKYDAKATFFVVNTPFASTISQIAADGHALAMHTATHDFSRVYSSEKAYFEDLEKIESIIEEYAGYRPRILRFPGGGSNTVSKKYCKGIMTSLTQQVKEKGYLYYDWNVDSDDAGSARTPEEVFRNVVEGCSTRKSSIVLMHDIKSYTIDAIEDILIWGQANGYTFEALTEDVPEIHHTVRN